MDEKKYTLEDVETLRGKTDVSYEEAVGLLEKYDGDIARALIELEKRGKLEGQDAKIHISVDMRAAEFIKKWWNKGLETRVIVERKDERLVSLPVLFMILALVLGWRLFAVAAILALVTGCRVFLRGRTDAAPEAAAAPAEPEADAAPAPEAQEDAQKKDEDGFHTITIE